MGFEPQKFFIGLIDFFSILMPGALLTYLGKDWIAVKFDMPNGFPIQGAEASIVFLFASYLLGHFAFLLSSALDDLIYDPLREWTDWGQISKRLARGKMRKIVNAFGCHWLKRGKKPPFLRRKPCCSRPPSS